MRTGAHKGIPEHCPRLTFVDGCHREFAFGHDEVAPIQHKGLDPRNGWGCTIVGAMSTMVCASDISSHCLMYAFELTDDPSTSWGSTYDNCYSPFFFPLNDRRHKSRIHLTKHSTLCKRLTSRNQRHRILSGNSPAAQLNLGLMCCSIFESTIGYLGGLISAYELSGKQYFFLIQKAQQLADRLSLGWSQVSVFECAL